MSIESSTRGPRGPKKQVLLESNNIDNTKSALEKVSVRHISVMLRIEDVASFEVLYHQMISSLTGFVGRMISLRKFKHSLIFFSFLHFVFLMFIRTFSIPVSIQCLLSYFNIKKYVTNSN